MHTDRHGPHARLSPYVMYTKVYAPDPWSRRRASKPLPEPKFPGKRRGEPKQMAKSTLLLSPSHAHALLGWRPKRHKMRPKPPNFPRRATPQSDINPNLHSPQSSASHRTSHPRNCPSSSPSLPTRAITARRPGFVAWNGKRGLYRSGH